MQPLSSLRCDNSNEATTKQQRYVKIYEFIRNYYTLCWVQSQFPWSRVCADNFYRRFSDSPKNHSVWKNATRKIFSSEDASSCIDRIIKLDYFMVNLYILNKYVRNVCRWKALSVWLNVAMLTREFSVSEQFPRVRATTGELVAETYPSTLEDVCPTLADISIQAGLGNTVGRACNMKSRHLWEFILQQKLSAKAHAQSSPSYIPGGGKIARLRCFSPRMQTSLFFARDSLRRGLLRKLGTTCTLLDRGNKCILSHWICAMLASKEFLSTT